MTIVFSTDQIYLHGGIEKVMAEKANYFADVCGYKVIILTSEQRGQKPCYSLSSKIQFIDLGVNYERNKSYLSFTNLKKVPRHVLQLQRVLKRLKPNAVIVSNIGFDYYAMPFLNRFSKKIKEFHSSRYFEQHLDSGKKSFFQKLLFKFNHWIESKYHHIVVLNKDESAFYKNSNVVIIPNPISNSIDTASLIKYQVVAAGRIAPVKGFDKLIEAWKLVHEVEPGWQLHIYGDDYLGTQEVLQELIEKYKLGGSIIFKGSTNDIVNTFTDYSIYAMSSVTECFPMVLLEALSVGLPIVSFDCPTGPKNIVSDALDGLLVTNQDVPGLAEKLLLLIQNPEQRKKMGEQAKENSKRFSTPVIMQQWINLLKS